MPRKTTRSNCEEPERADAHSLSIASMASTMAIPSASRIPASTDHALRISLAQGSEDGDRSPWSVQNVRDASPEAPPPSSVPPPPDGEGAPAGGVKASRRRRHHALDAKSAFG